MLFVLVSVFLPTIKIGLKKLLHGNANVAPGEIYGHRITGFACCTLAEYSDSQSSLRKTRAVVNQRFVVSLLNPPSRFSFHD